MSINIKDLEKSYSIPVRDNTLGAFVERVRESFPDDTDVKDISVDATIVKDVYGKRVETTISFTLVEERD